MWSLVHLFRKERKAAVSIEFALLGLMFFTLIFAILETALVFMSQIVLDNAVAEVARQLQTGELQKKSIAESDFRKLLCNETNLLLSCSGISLDLQTYANFAAVPTTVSMTGANVNTTSFGFNPPAPSAISALRVFYKWPLSTTLVGQYLATTSDNARILVSIAVFKSEPY